MAIFPQNSPGLSLLFSVLLNRKSEISICLLWKYLQLSALESYRIFLDFFKLLFNVIRKCPIHCIFLECHELFAFYCQIFFLLGNFNFLLILRQLPMLHIIFLSSFCSLFSKLNFLPYFFIPLFYSRRSFPVFTVQH